MQCVPYWGLQPKNCQVGYNIFNPNSAMFLDFYQPDKRNGNRQIWLRSTNDVRFNRYILYVQEVVTHFV